MPTPHLPHGWDAGVLFEEKSGVLPCSDLFHQLGDVEMVTSADAGPVDAAVAAYQAHPVLMDYVPLTPATRCRLNELADLQPGVLAAMHGSTFVGDGGPRCVPPRTCCNAGSARCRLTHHAAWSTVRLMPDTHATIEGASASARAPHRRRTAGID